METGPPVAPLCERFPAAFVCDDFESGIGDDWDSAANAATSSVRAWGGDSSLEVNMAAGAAGDGRVQTRREFGDGPLFAQVRVFIVESSLVDRAVLFHFGTPQVNVVTAPAATIFSEEAGERSGPALDQGRWLCVRLELSAEDENERRDARLFVDDAAVLVVGGVSQGSLRDFWVGPGFGDGSRGVHAFFDDVLVTGTPITCE